MSARPVVSALVFGLSLAALAPLSPLAAQEYRRRGADDDRQSSYVPPRTEREDVSRAPSRRVEVVTQAQPRVLTLQRAPQRGWGRDQWVRSGYRPVTVYVVDGRYYDRYDASYWRGRPSHTVRQVVVYERAGHYYHDHDDHYGYGYGEAHRDWHQDYERRHREWHREHHPRERNYDRRHREWHERQRERHRDWHQDRRDDRYDRDDRYGHRHDRDWDGHR